MDMDAGYLRAVQEYLPGYPVVFDHYHVSAFINKAIDELRRQQQAQLEDEQRKALKGTRFLLWTITKSFSTKNRDRLNTLLKPTDPYSQSTP